MNEKLLAPFQDARGGGKSDSDETDIEVGDDLREQPDITEEASISIGNTSLRCSIPHADEDDEGEEGDSDSSEGLDIEDDVAEDFMNNCEVAEEEQRGILQRAMATSDLSPESGSEEEREGEEMLDEEGMPLPSSMAKKGKQGKPKGLPKFDRQPGKRHVEEQGSRKGGKPHIKGSQGGKLRPGEKKKLRRAKMEAKRHDRLEQRSNIDLRQVWERVHALVEWERDMDALPPCPKPAVDRIKRLCCAYGVRCVVNGTSSSSSSGKHKARTVVIHSTTKTAMPSDEELSRVAQIADPAPLRPSHSTKPTKGKSKAKDKQKQKKSAPSKQQARSPSFVTGGMVEAEGEMSYAEPAAQMESGDQDVLATVAPRRPTLGATRGAKLAVGGEETGEFGGFEKHTTGFGSKMLAKMGYVEGEGLGKRRQGMVEPIQAFSRPTRRGLGAD